MTTVTPVRVLHVIGSMNMGGAETIIMDLYRNVDRTKYQFDFAIHTEEKCLFEQEIEKLGGKIYRFKRFNGINFVSYIRQWNQFFKEHTEHFIVHGHIGSCAALYLYVAKANGKKAIAHSHNTLKKQGFDIHQFLWTMYSFPTRNIADFFLGCSYQAGVDRYGKKVADSIKFMVLNNGIDSNKFMFDPEQRQKVRDELGIADSTVVIGHVGRMVEQKNHKFLINVFNEYQKSIRSDSVLVLVGDGVLMDEINNLISNLNLTDKVYCLGTRTDTNYLLSAFDCFVFPSVNEGLGISVIEAQASGLPVICSDVLPIETKISPDIVYLSLNESYAGWANTIQKVNLNKNRTECNKYIGKNNYDIQGVALSLQEVYHSLLES